MFVFSLAGGGAAGPACRQKSVSKAHAQSGSGVSNQCVKIIMQDQFLQKWSSRISEEEDFSSYKTYKDVHQFEEYVDLLPEYLKYSQHRDYN